MGGIKASLATNDRRFRFDADVRAPQDHRSLLQNDVRRSVHPQRCQYSLKRDLPTRLNTSVFEGFPLPPPLNPGPSIYFSASSRMRRPATRDSVVLSASSAFAVCDSLLRMAHCLIVELPESELRDIRYTIDILATRTNQILGSAERDLSLNFDRLAIIPGECLIYPCSSSDISQISTPSLEPKTLVLSWSQTLSLRILVDRTPFPHPATIGTSPVEHPLLLQPQLGRRFASQPRLRSQLQPLAQFRVMVVSPSRFPLGIMSGFPTGLITLLFAHPGSSYICRWKPNIDFSHQASRVFIPRSQDSPVVADITSWGNCLCVGAFLVSKLVYPPSPSHC